MILPIGHTYWQQREGACTPNHREQQIYQDAIACLRQTEPSHPANQDIRN